MKGWRKRFGGEVRDWLVQGSDPSLRCRVLTELLDRPADSPEVLKAKEDIKTNGAAARVLSQQSSAGHWGKEEDFYVRSKYKGTVWNLILLAELVPGSADERIARAADFVLRWSRRQDGGFTHIGSPDGGRTAPLACLSGNLVSSLVRLGFGSDPRLLPSYDHIDRLGRKELPLGKGRCGRCRTGLVKVLKGLDAIPVEHRADGWETLRDALAEEIADLCLPGTKEQGPRPDWSRFGFPLMWNTDLIEILDLIRLPASDERVDEAIRIVLSKRDEEGRWMEEGAITGRTLVSFGNRHRPSRWVTFRALSMLKRLPD